MLQNKINGKFALYFTENGVQQKKNIKRYSGMFKHLKKHNTIYTNSIRHSTVYICKWNTADACIEYK